MNRPRLLFVCGKNQWRSPTAEAIYRNDTRVAVRSAGVSDKSRHRVSTDDLEWADLVLVMEKKHKARILDMFGEQPNLPPIIALDIPDEYQRMDQELVALIQAGTEFHLKQNFNLVESSGSAGIAGDEAGA